MALNEVQARVRPSLSFLSFLLPAFLVAFLFFVPWFYGLRYPRHQLSAELVVFTFSFFVFPFLKWNEVFKQGDSEMDVWVFSAFGLGLLYTFISVVPALSLMALLRLTACLCVYTLVRVACAREIRLQFFLVSMVLCGLFYSAYGLLQYYGFLPHTYWTESWFLASRFINGGHFGAFLLIPLFTAFSLLISTRKTLIQAMLLPAVFIMSWAFLLTHSRTPWLVFAAGSCLFLWLLNRHRLLEKKERVVISFILLGSLGLFVIAGGAKEILPRFQQMWGKTAVIFDPQASGQFYSLRYRWLLWKEAFAALLARPWGWGLGAFESVFPQFRVHADRFHIDYAHNEILQIGVDLGIPGLLFLGGILFSYFTRMGRFLRSSHPSRSHKIYAVGFMTIVASLFLASQADFPLRVYANSFFFAAVLALSFSLFGFLPVSVRPQGVPLGAKSNQNLFRFALPPLFLIFTLLAARELWAQAHYLKAMELDKNFDWTDALLKYERALRPSPLSTEPYEALASFLQRKEALSFKREEKNKFLERSLWAYDQAIKRNPYKASLRYQLALLYEDEGKFEEAKKEFLNAVSLEPFNAVFLSEYGLFALKQGWQEQAFAAFEKFRAIPYKEGSRLANLPELIQVCSQYLKDKKDLARIIPNTSEGHYQLGIFFGNQGRWDLADREFQTALRQGKKRQIFADYWSSTARPIALFYISKEHLKQARELFEEAVEKNPADSEAVKRLEEINAGTSL